MGAMVFGDCFTCKISTMYGPIPKEVSKFFEEEKAWSWRLLRWKVRTRQATREEWLQIYRNERIRRRSECEQHIDPG